MKPDLKDSEGKEPPKQVVEVFKALEDPQWDYRTIHGVSKQSHISESEVQTIFSHYNDVIVQAPFTSASGEPLYFSKRSRSDLKTTWDFFWRNR